MPICVKSRFKCSPTIESCPPRLANLLPVAIVSFVPACNIFQQAFAVHLYCFWCRPMKRRPNPGGNNALFNTVRQNLITMLKTYFCVSGGAYKDAGGSDVLTATLTSSSALSSSLDGRSGKASISCSATAAFIAVASGNLGSGPCDHALDGGEASSLEFSFNELSKCSADSALKAAEDFGTRTLVAWPTNFNVKPSKSRKPNQQRDFG